MKTFASLALKKPMKTFQCMMFAEFSIYCSSVIRRKSLRKSSLSVCFTWRMLPQKLAHRFEVWVNPWICQSVTNASIVQTLLLQNLQLHSHLYNYSCSSVQPHFSSAEQKRRRWESVWFWRACSPSAASPYVKVINTWFILIAGCGGFRTVSPWLTLLSYYLHVLILV